MPQYSAGKGAKKGIKGTLVSAGSAAVVAAIGVLLAPDAWAQVVDAVSGMDKGVYLVALLPLAHGVLEAIRNRLQFKG